MTFVLEATRPAPLPEVLELMTPEAGVLKVWVPGRLKNLLNASRLHWRSRQKYEKEWRERVAYLVGWELKRLAARWQPETPKRIQITAVVSRLFDDNPISSGLNASLKPVVDGLLPERVVRRRKAPSYVERGAGVIHDDSTRSGHEFVPPVQIARMPYKATPKVPFSPKIDPRGVLIVVRLKEAP